MEPEFKQLEEQKNSLEKKYNEHILESQSAILELEGELKMIKDLNASAERLSLSPKKKQQSSESESLKRIKELEEVVKNHREIEARFKSGNDKLLAEKRELTENISKVKNEHSRVVACQQIENTKLVNDLNTLKSQIKSQQAHYNENLHAKEKEKITLNTEVLALRGLKKQLKNLQEENKKLRNDLRHKNIADKKANSPLTKHVEIQTTHSIQEHESILRENFALKTEIQAYSKKSSKCSSTQTEVMNSDDEDSLEDIMKMMVTIPRILSPMRPSSPYHIISKPQIPDIIITPCTPTLDEVQNFEQFCSSESAGNTICTIKMEDSFAPVDLKKEQVKDEIFSQPTDDSVENSFTSFCLNGEDIKEYSDHSTFENIAETLSDNLENDTSKLEYCSQKENRQFEEQTIGIIPESSENSRNISIPDLDENKMVVHNEVEENFNSDDTCTLRTVENEKQISIDTAVVYKTENSLVEVPNEVSQIRENNFKNENAAKDDSETTEVKLPLPSLDEGVTEPTTRDDKKPALIRRRKYRIPPKITDLMKLRHKSLRKQMMSRKLKARKFQRQDSVLRALQVLKRSKINFTISNESTLPLRWGEYNWLLGPPLVHSELQSNPVPNELPKLKHQIQKLSCPSKSCKNVNMLLDNNSGKLFGFFTVKQERISPSHSKIEEISHSKPDNTLKWLNNSLKNDITPDNLLEKLAELVSEKLRNKNPKRKRTVRNDSEFYSETETEIERLFEKPSYDVLQRNKMLLKKAKYDLGRGSTSLTSLEEGYTKNSPNEMPASTENSPLLQNQIVETYTKCPDLLSPLDQCRKHPAVSTVSNKAVRSLWNEPVQKEEPKIEEITLPNSKVIPENTDSCDSFKYPICPDLLSPMSSCTTDTPKIRGFGKLSTPKNKGANKALGSFNSVMISPVKHIDEMSKQSFSNADFTFDPGEGETPIKSEFKLERCIDEDIQSGFIKLEAVVDDKMTSYTSSDEKHFMELKPERSDVGSPEKFEVQPLGILVKENSEQSPNKLSFSLEENSPECTELPNLMSIFGSKIRQYQNKSAQLKGNLFDNNNLMKLETSNINDLLKMDKNKTDLPEEKGYLKDTAPPQPRDSSGLEIRNFNETERTGTEEAELFTPIKKILGKLDEKEQSSVQSSGSTSMDVKNTTIVLDTPSSFCINQLLSNEGEMDLEVASFVENFESNRHTLQKEYIIRNIFQTTDNIGKENMTTDNIEGEITKENVPVKISAHDILEILPRSEVVDIPSCPQSPDPDADLQINAILRIIPLEKETKTESDKIRPRRSTRVSRKIVSSSSEVESEDDAPLPLKTVGNSLGSPTCNKRQRGRPRKYPPKEEVVCKRGMPKKSQARDSSAEVKKANDSSAEEKQATDLSAEEKEAKDLSVLEMVSKRTEEDNQSHIERKYLLKESLAPEKVVRKRGRPRKFQAKDSSAEVKEAKNLSAEEREAKDPSAEEMDLKRTENPDESLPAEIIGSIARKASAEEKQARDSSAEGKETKDLSAEEVESKSNYIESVVDKSHIERKYPPKESSTPGKMASKRGRPRKSRTKDLSAEVKEANDSSAREKEAKDFSADEIEAKDSSADEIELKRSCTENPDESEPAEVIRSIVDKSEEDKQAHTERKYPPKESLAPEKVRRKKVRTRKFPAEDLSAAEVKEANDSSADEKESKNWSAYEKDSSAEEMRSERTENPVKSEPAKIIGSTVEKSEEDNQILNNEAVNVLKKPVEKKKQKMSKLKSNILRQMREQKKMFRSGKPSPHSEDVEIGCDVIGNNADKINLEVRNDSSSWGCQQGIVNYGSNKKINIVQNIVLKPAVQIYPVKPLDLCLSSSQSSADNVEKKRISRVRKKCDILSQIMGEMDKDRPKQPPKPTVTKKLIPQGIEDKQWRKGLLDIAEITHSNNNDVKDNYGSGDHFGGRYSGFLKKGEELPGKIRLLLKKLMQIPSEDEIPDHIIMEFKRIPVDLIVNSIIHEVARDFRDKPDAKYYPAPLMTRTQRIYLCLMLRLEREKVDNLVDTFLMRTKHYIFRQSCGLKAAIPLTRIFMGLCRIRADIHRMRMFCCEAFFYVGDFAVPILFVVLTSWIEVIPMEAELKNYPMAKVLVQLVHMKSFVSAGYNLLPLKCLLSQYYGYPKERWNCDTVFEEISQEYLRNPSFTSDFAIRLFCRNNDTKWRM
ncbi:hypothetical protein JTB14_034182 [Gonioctena quinquepunctata]|nr:hypothetical protein JTB14_034182 [Gonioctena quinquepunctata]